MNNVKRFIPYICAIALFVALAYTYAPEVLKGKVVNQSDIASWHGMSHEITSYNEAHPNEDPTLWTNSMFSGMPAFTISVIYKGDFTKYLYKLLFLGQRPPSYLIISLIGGFLLLLAFGVNPWLAIAGAIGITFCSYNFQIIQVGHNTKMEAIAFMPWVLAAVAYTYRKHALLGAGLFALALSFQVKSNHPQITYYLGMMVLFFVAAECYTAIKERKLKRFMLTSCLVLAGGLLGIAANINHLWPMQEYTKYSMRGGSELSGEEENAGKKGLKLDYATQWSYSPGETFNLLIPNFKGGASGGDAFGKNSETVQWLKSQGHPGAEQTARSLPAYWGAQPFTAGPMYMGAVIIFLFVLGLFLTRGTLRWWVIALGIITLLLSWGGNAMWFTRFFSEYIPLYNKFRTVSMILVIFQVLFPLLGMIAVQQLLDPRPATRNPQPATSNPQPATRNPQPATRNPQPATSNPQPATGAPPFTPRNLRPATCDRQSEPRSLQPATRDPRTSDPGFFRPLYWAGGLTAGFCLLMALMPSLSGSFLSGYESNMGIPNEMLSAIQADRQHFLSADAFRSFCFIVLAFGALWFGIKKKMKREWVFACLGLLILVDMWPIGKRYLNNDHFVRQREFRQQFDKRPVDEMILQDPDLYYRVLDLTTNIFNDAHVSYWHKTIGGYSPAKLQRYQEMIDHYIYSEVRTMVNEISKCATWDEAEEAVSPFPVLNMLNTRYVVIQADGMPVVNGAAFGNAWFCSHVVWVTSPDEEIAMVGAVDLSKSAVIHESYKHLFQDINGLLFDSDASFNSTGPAFDTEATLQLSKYAPNALEFTYSSASPQLAVFSDVFYPKGWSAWIDNMPVEIARANYILRALPLPEGTHTIRFIFAPESFTKGATYSRISSALLLLLIALGFCARGNIFSIRSSTNSVQSNANGVQSSTNSVQSNANGARSSTNSLRRNP